MQDLKNIDFSRGVYSEDINNNFERLRKAIQDERLHTGGYGVIRGFELEKVGDLSVEVAPGQLIDQNGIGREVPGDTVELSGLEEKDRTEEELEVSSQGRIELPSTPVSVERIVLQEDESTEISYTTVEDNTVIVDTGYAGQEVIVEYTVIEPRVDAIFVTTQGEIRVSEGLESTSPSHVKLDEYKDKIIVGAARVFQDGGQTKFEIYDDLKDYRRLFVDEDNVLHVYGRPFKGTQIFFEEPEPEENIFWYDRESNLLMTWFDEEGGYWLPVNDLSAMPFTEVKIWGPEDKDWPSDDQTFRFGEHELNMLYIPDYNQLQVIIDNNFLMSDQYEEIVEEDETGYKTGTGFKLKKPLDSPTHVEARVVHSARRGASRQVFQRSAVFVETGVDIYDPQQHINRSIRAKAPYLVGEEQLEVFLNGKKLDCIDPDEDGKPGFYEMRGQYSKAEKGHKGDKGTYFKISDYTELKEGDRISHKVTLFVYSYDHLNELLRRYEERLAELEDLVERTAYFQENPDDFIKKGEELVMEEVPQPVRKNLYGEPFYRTLGQDDFDHRNIAELQDIDRDDFIQVFADGLSLRKDSDFLIIPRERGIGLEVFDIEEFGEVYINGIRRGL